MLLCTQGIRLGKIDTVIREEAQDMTLDQIVAIGRKAQACSQYAGSHIDELLWRTSVADKAGPFSTEPPTLDLASLYFGWISKKLIAALAERFKSSPEADRPICMANFWNKHDYGMLFGSRLFGTGVFLRA
jgi:hypothetical protein